MEQKSSGISLINASWPEFIYHKFSQFSNDFLTFPKMIRLIVDILELIHFGNTLDNKQED